MKNHFPISETFNNPLEKNLRRLNLITFKKMLIMTVIVETIITLLIIYNSNQNLIPEIFLNLLNAVFFLIILVWGFFLGKQAGLQQKGENTEKK